MQKQHKLRNVSSHDRTIEEIKSERRHRRIGHLKVTINDNADTRNKLECIGWLRDRLRLQCKSTIDLCDLLMSKELTPAQESFVKAKYEKAQTNLVLNDCIELLF